MRTDHFGAGANLTRRRCVAMSVVWISEGDLLPDYAPNSPLSFQVSGARAASPGVPRMSAQRFARYVSRSEVAVRLANDPVYDDLPELVDDVPANDDQERRPQLVEPLPSAPPADVDQHQMPDVCTRACHHCADPVRYELTVVLLFYQGDVYAVSRSLFDAQPTVLDLWQGHVNEVQRGQQVSLRDDCRELFEPNAEGEVLFALDPFATDAERDAVMAEALKGLPGRNPWVVDAWLWLVGLTRTAFRLVRPQDYVGLTIAESLAVE